MATNRPFAYNPAQTAISGCIQVGDLAVGSPSEGFASTGLTWWGGPDEDLGYVIAYSQPNGLHPTPLFNNEPLTLSTTYKGVDVVLSNSNRTAYQQFGYQQSVVGNTRMGQYAKVMFSVHVTLAAPETLSNSHFIGIGYTSMNYQGNPYGGFPGNDNKSMGYCSDGTIWYNGSQVITGLTLSSWGHDDRIDIAINNDTNSMWVRVNGGDWNNNPAADPITGSNSIEIIGPANYPVLCPGYEGTMSVLLISPHGQIPGYSQLGANVTASLGFKRTPNNDSAFVDFVNNYYNAGVTGATGAAAWLNANGYWTSYSGFGSSGFQWMTINSITSTTASGIGQNSITIAITQSGGGMEAHTGMYSAATFPETYGVPPSGTQILNQAAGSFTAVFSQPVQDPLVAFASVGNPGLPVPVHVSAPFTPIWETATTYQNAVSGTQYTQFTGQEGFNIIRIDGLVSTVSFYYTVSEYYCTICFGFIDQN